MSLSAFFAPDDIPEELFRQDPALYPPDLAPIVSKPARLAELLGVFDDLSLIDFKADPRTFSVHRLVQAAARDALGPDRGVYAQGEAAIASVRGWREVDRLSTELLLGRPRAVTTVPTPGLADVDRGPRGWPTPVLRRARSAR